MLEDTDWYLLFTGAFWGGAAIALLLWWVPTWIARKSLRGTWRSWVLAPAIPFQISSRNTWPFMFAAASASLSIALLTLPAEVLAWEQARHALWKLFFVPWLFVVVSFIWWPLWLAPSWYRKWAANGGTQGTSPWEDAEVETVQAARPSKTRERQLADIQRCRTAIQDNTHQREDHRP